MIDKLKALPGFVWTGLLSLVGIIFYIIKAKQLDTANSKVETAEYKQQDALDHQSTTTIQKQIEEAVEQNDEAKQKQLTNEELAKKLDNI
jgi:hypothetical protein